jgi:hypothetical protein
MLLMVSAVAMITRFQEGLKEIFYTAGQLAISSQHPVPQRYFELRLELTIETLRHRGKQSSGRGSRLVTRDFK